MLEDKKKNNVWKDNLQRKLAVKLVLIRLGSIFTVLHQVSIIQTGVNICFGQSQPIVQSHALHLRIDLRNHGRAHFHKVHPFLSVNSNL